MISIVGWASSIHIRRQCDKFGVCTLSTKLWSPPPPEIYMLKPPPPLSVSCVFRNNLMGSDILSTLLVHVQAIKEVTGYFCIRRNLQGCLWLGGQEHGPGTQSEWGQELLPHSVSPPGLLWALVVSSAKWG